MTHPSTAKASQKHENLFYIHGNVFPRFCVARTRRKRSRTFYRGWIASAQFSRVFIILFSVVHLSKCNLFFLVPKFTFYFYWFHIKTLTFIVNVRRCWGDCETFICFFFSGVRVDCKIRWTYVATSVQVWHYLSAIRTGIVIIIVKIYFINSTFLYFAISLFGHSWMLSFIHQIFFHFILHFWI